MKTDVLPSKVEIRHPKDPFGGGMTQVWATVGRDEVQAFFYDPDELSFTVEELEGLTIQEMRDLVRRKKGETP